MSYYFNNMVNPCLLDRYKVKVVSQPEFIILVNTALPGSASDTMQLPIRGTDMTIDWGDGFVQTGVTQTATPSSANWMTRVYPDGGGVKQIKITGLDWIYFNNTSDRLKLLEIQNCGTGQWTTMNSSFAGCSNMIWKANDIANVSNVTDFGGTFRLCSNFNGNISGWDVGNGIIFGGFNLGMFDGCSSFNQNLNTWNTANATTMRMMFRDTISYDQPMNNWNVSKVTDFREMFRNSIFNQNIGGWQINTLQDVTMFRMFNLNNLFDNGGSDDIGSWNMSKVTNISFMFSQPFGETSKFNRNISGWQFDNLIGVGGAFYFATTFNQDITGWDVSKVSSYGGTNSIFTGASSLNQNFGAWNLRLEGVDLQAIFRLTGLSTENYSRTLIEWANKVYANDAPLTVNMIRQQGRTYNNVNYYTGLQFNNAVDARNYLVNVAGWTITDDTQV